MALVLLLMGQEDKRTTVLHFLIALFLLCLNKVLRKTNVVTGALQNLPFY